MPYYTYFIIFLSIPSSFNLYQFVNAFQSKDRLDFWNVCVLNRASCLFWVQNLTTVHWCPAQTPSSKMVQPSCSCSGLACRSQLPSFSGELRTADGAILPTRLPIAFSQWWTNVGRQSLCKGSVSLPQGGTTPDVYVPEGSPLHPPPGTGSELDLTWGHISAQFPPLPPSCFTPSFTGFPWEHTLSKPHAPDSLPQALLLRNLTWGNMFRCTWEGTDIRYYTEAYIINVSSRCWGYRRYL